MEENSGVFNVKCLKTEEKKRQGSSLKRRHSSMEGRPEPHVLSPDQGAPAGSTSGPPVGSPDQSPPANSS